MTWDDVLKRDDLIGGEIEIRDGLNYYYRAPIKSITTDGKMITIEPEWVARRGRSGVWTRLRNFQPWRVDILRVKPYDHRRGRILFELQTVGPSVIYPRGDASLLDHSKVVDSVD